MLVLVWEGGAGDPSPTRCDNDHSLQIWRRTPTTSRERLGLPWASSCSPPPLIIGRFVVGMDGPSVPIALRCSPKPSLHRTHFASFVAQFACVSWTGGRSGIGREPAHPRRRADLLSSWGTHLRLLLVPGRDAIRSCLVLPAEHASRTPHPPSRCAVR